MLRIFFNLFTLPAVHLLGWILSIIRWFRPKRSSKPVDPDWTNQATEREITTAWLTGKYPPHPPGRKRPRPSDAEIRKLAERIIKVAKEQQKE